MCLINPFATGTVLAFSVGVLLMLSGGGLIVGMFANQAFDFSRSILTNSLSTLRLFFYQKAIKIDSLLLRYASVKCFYIL